MHVSTRMISTFKCKPDRTQKLMICLQHRGSLSGNHTRTHCAELSIRRNLRHADVQVTRFVQLPSKTILVRSRPAGLLQLLSGASAGSQTALEITPLSQVSVVDCLLLRKFGLSHTRPSPLLPARVSLQLQFNATPCLPNHSHRE